MKKPKIAVPDIHHFMGNYLTALRSIGMIPILISLRSGQIRNTYQYDFLDYEDFHSRDFDGLLLPGGGDMKPSFFHQENQGSVGIVEDLDILQLHVLDQFVADRKPVLGICRGLQVINVYFGGTLIQHLSTSEIHSTGKDEPDKVHTCRTEQGSWIRDLYGEVFAQNSAHHQAVDCPGRGMVIDGRCTADLAVESMHHESLPIYGVQWHPERMCLEHAREDTADGLPVLEFFRSLCGETEPHCTKGEHNAKEKENSK